MSRRAVLGLLPAAFLAGCAATSRDGSRGIGTPGPAPPAWTTPAVHSAPHPARAPVTPRAAAAPPADTSGPTGSAVLPATLVNRRPTRWGIVLPDITQTVPAGGTPTLALTYHACGGPGGSGGSGYDPTKHHQPGTGIRADQWGQVT